MRETDDGAVAVSRAGMELVLPNSTGTEGTHPPPLPPSVGGCVVCVLQLLSSELEGSGEEVR